MSAALCGCGCGLPAPIATQTYAPRGLVKGEPRPFRHGHHARKPEDRYTVDGQTGCWNWPMFVNNKGYGRLLRRDGTVALAHVYFYERARGPVPDWLELDHLCRNRLCVNPDHQEAVTHAENCRRGAKAKVTPVIAAYIRENYSVVNGYELATRFGIARSTVTNIAAGRNWL